MRAHPALCALLLSRLVLVHAAILFGDKRCIRRQPPRGSLVCARDFTLLFALCVHWSQQQLACADLLPGPPTSMPIFGT